MQEDFKSLETQVLIDMLAQQTALYTAKIAEKNSVELQQYEYEISMIQSELNSRQQTTGNVRLTDPGTEFNPENN